MEPSGATPSGISALGTVYMSIDGLVDLEAELAKLNIELEAVLGHLKGVQGKLKNKNFVDKAPEAVVQVQRDKEAELIEKRDKLSEMIATLSVS
jgi:valyl-tRNA synthetase